MVILKSGTQAMANITIEGKIIERVHRFSYLGSISTQDGRCVEETRTRIIIAEESINKVSILVTNTSITVGLRKRFIKAYVWSTFLYGYGAWNVSIKALEMWLYRRRLKTPWVDHKSNEQVLQRADAKREIMTNIRQRQLRFLVYTLRVQHLGSLCLRVKSRKREGEDAQGISLWMDWQEAVVVTCRRRRCCG